jgi:hypothetical protein
MDKFAPYGKAITAAIIAALTAYVSVQPNGVNGGEWANVAVAFLTALGLVWAVPNKDPEATHQDESVQPPAEGDRGGMWGG